MAIMRHWKRCLRIVKIRGLQPIRFGQVWFFVSDVCYNAIVSKGHLEEEAKISLPLSLA